MNTMAIVGFIVVGVISMISIVGSCMLVETKKDMFYLYLLFDSILVACITAIAGVTGIVSVMVPPEAISYALLAFWNAILFVISGNNRVIIAYVKYKKWQVILFKISLCLSFLTFLVLAMYFMSNDFPNPLMSD